MLKVYNYKNEFMGIVESEKDSYTMEVLATGLKTLCFKAPCREEYFTMLSEENYIETKDYNYVIKEVNYDGNDFFTVYATANIEAIGGIVFPHFDVFHKSLKEAYEYCLQRSAPWKLVYHSQDSTQCDYQLPYVTAIDMIRQIAEDFRQELWFDTKNKLLHIYDKDGLGKPLGAYYSNELKLKNLKKQSSTYDYATVLYPVGKDGLTIQSINNGREWIDNFQYSNKYIEKVWINEDYDIAEKLKAAAEIYLDEIAQPKASYKLSLSDLGKTVALGDSVMLIDKLKRLKQKQRVVKIIRYADAPEKDQIELSNLQEDFARNFVIEQKRIAKEIAYIKSVIANLK